MNTTTSMPSATGAEERRIMFRLLVLLTFAAGFTDTAGFVMLFELFTAHITGNTVIAAADIVHRGGAGALAALLMLPIFVITVVVCTLLMDTARGRWQERTLSLMIVAETVLLAAFFGAAQMLDPSNSTPDGLPVIIVGGVGVVAMAVQNTIAGELPKPSTVMTGNLTTLIIDAVRLVRAIITRDTALRAKTMQRLPLLWPTFLSFTLGAVVAAIGVVTLHYWCLLIPIPVAAAAAVISIRGYNKPQAERAARDWG